MISQWAKVESQGHQPSFRVTLRGIPLRGSYWAQPAVDWKSSKGLPWCRCL